MQKYVSLFFECIFLVLCSMYACNITCCDSFLTGVLVPEHYHDSCSNRTFGKTFFSIRPQDSNSALRLAKIVSEDHGNSWGLDLSLGIAQSFSRKNNILARWFLFNECTQVTVGVPSDTRSFTVDGGQLGLVSTDGDPGLMGTLSLNPTLHNKSIIANAWFDLSDYVCGLWFRTFLTVVQASTKLGMRTSNTNNIAQLGNYPNGVYTTDCEDVPIEYTSLCSAFIGDAPFGSIPDLKYAKFYSGHKTKTALASIRTDLNYDIVTCPNGFFNVGGTVIIPTGNKPKNVYLFEPIVGANGSWQIGATILGAYHFLPDCNENSIDVYVDATATYLTKSKQTRVFSLGSNGAGSQYMLLKVFDLDVGAVQSGERVANIFAGQAHIGGSGMLDGSVMLHFARCNGLSCDIGYNLWARSKERIGSTAFVRNFIQNAYGVKGNLPLSSIDSFSELCIDDLNTASNSTLGNPAPTDAQTEVLDVCDIDFNAALHPSTFSNKLFGCIGYSRDLCSSDATIALFVEAEVEIGQKKRALNQWACALNIAVSF